MKRLCVANRAVDSALVNAKVGPHDDKKVYPVNVNGGYIGTGARSRVHGVPSSSAGVN